MKIGDRVLSRMGRVCDIEAMSKEGLVSRIKFTDGNVNICYTKDLKPINFTNYLKLL